MSYIKGKFKNLIYESDNGYKVGLFKVIETDDENLENNKTITFTGYFTELNKEDKYLLYGNYIFHNRYGYQFNVSHYEKVKPEGKDAIIDFLTSSFVKGCGVKLATSIYEIFGDSTLDKIKENKENLLLVPKMTTKKADSIYHSIIKYFSLDKEILELKTMGFSVKETMNLINLYGEKITNIIDENIYFLKDIIDFKKLDSIFLTKYDALDQRRVKACIIQSIKESTFSNGDIYLTKEEILNQLKHHQINTNIDDYLVSLFNEKEIFIQNERYYLLNDYIDELNNALAISSLMKKGEKLIKNFKSLVKKAEQELNITYNEEQLNAIKCALENNISIITGGPGTGKTTIIKGIIKIYSLMEKIEPFNLNKYVCLLAPTGRAAKRMSETSKIPAMTIHRFLKWDKENNTFGINEFNKLSYNLIIIDEVSMLDNHLLSSLFKGINLNTKIIFVGDEYQLPSVGPGLILKDMINANIKHISLKNIYRQSENSYIPILARNVKDKIISNELLNRKDDYNFIECSSKEIKEYIIKILEKAEEKNMNISNVQVLAPMYKGENGIDNLNILLQDIFNPPSESKDEVQIGPVLYRVGDKILNLINDVDNNIYNGDIGYVKEVNIDSKTDYLVINYYNHDVSYKKENLNSITHAYAISIHKSQGSEFEHVIMPICPSYNRMLYNKLLYTGISRAKKSLIILGSSTSFEQSINNNYSQVRKTSLTEKIMNNLK